MFSILVLLAFKLSTQLLRHKIDKDYKGKVCSFIDYLNDKAPCHGEGHNCRDHLETLTPEAKKKNEDMHPPALTAEKILAPEGTRVNHPPALNQDSRNNFRRGVGRRTGQALDPHRPKLYNLTYLT